MPSDIETLECLFDWFNAREVSEDASARGVARRPRMASIPGTECEEQRERQQRTSRHGGEV